MAEEEIEIIYWVFPKSPDQTQYLSHRLSALFREFADWMDEVGPGNIPEAGDVGLALGSIRWRRIPR